MGEVRVAGPEGHGGNPGPDQLLAERCAADANEQRFLPHYLLDRLEEGLSNRRVRLHFRRLQVRDLLNRGRDARTAQSHLFGQLA